jgi:hypothetical protein
VSEEERARLVRRATRQRAVVAFAVLLVIAAHTLASFDLAAPLSHLLASLAISLLVVSSYLLGLLEERLASTPVVITLAIDPRPDEDLDVRDFNRYIEEHGIATSELPAAFAAWLHARTGWDGSVERRDTREEW